MKNFSKGFSLVKPIIVIVILAILGGGGYFWYQSVANLQKDAQSAIAKTASLQQESKKYGELKATIKSEYDRCQNFISQSQGDFGSFEYCKAYIQWVTAQKLLDASIK